MSSRWLVAILPIAPCLAAFQAGAFKVDVSPTTFPVIVNCGMFEKTADRLQHPLYARALVFADGASRIAIATVDSCMMPRELIDRAKRLVQQRTGIPENRILISATHTHSAPAAMSCLGSRAAQAYAGALPAKIADAIEGAAGRLQPARSGWSSIEAPDLTHTRRWILRPDKMKLDPFGNLTVRANMHPGYQNPEAVTESGPSDPQLSLLAISAPGGKPLAAIANFSQHYFGTSPVSPDYHGLFAEQFAARIGADVVLFTQGTSGDQMWMDYSQPKPPDTLDSYAAQLVDRAALAWRDVRYQPATTIAMAESRLRLDRRRPDAARLSWAAGVIATVGDRLPKTQPEVYAFEARHVDAEPSRELKLQAVRIGNVAMTAMPNEVFAITGLKLKLRSPLAATFNIELANGADGYIPPPEQHLLGGYTTWTARTAGLETQAEPRIVETLLGLLEKVSARPRRTGREPESAYSQAVRASRPHTYWRMDELEPSRYEGRVAMFLPGLEGRHTHSVYFAGGSRRLPPIAAGDATIEAWVWPGVEQTPVFGQPANLEPKRWHHVALIRAGDHTALWLNGAQHAVTGPLPDRIGAEFEGKVDDVAVYRRALSAEELAAHRTAAGIR